MDKHVKIVGWCYREYMQGGLTTEAGLPAIRDIALMIARCACNNHTICDDELRPIGEQMLTVCLAACWALLHVGAPLCALQFQLAAGQRCKS